MFQIKHVALAHQRGMATQPASYWAQDSQGLPAELAGVPQGR